MELSKSGYAVVTRMLAESTSLKYGYKSIIEGCFDYCIRRYGMEVPPEPKDVIVSQVMEILKSNEAAHR